MISLAGHQTRVYNCALKPISLEYLIVFIEIATPECPVASRVAELLNQWNSETNGIFQVFHWDILDLHIGKGG